MLNANRIADLFDIRKRFLRSTHLERDFADASALRGYVVTPPAKEAFDRLLQGLSPKSAQRAWRITGDYGTGKSSFALALAHILSAYSSVPQEVRRCVDFQSLGIKKPNLLPVLVTGVRAPLGESLRIALAAAIETQRAGGKPPRLLAQLKAKPTGSRDPHNGPHLIELVEEAQRYLRNSGRADGIVIILDELGKFLEFAALHPERQDIYLLQLLAEHASRSGDAPLFIVGLLHQGFHAYAEQLSPATQKEWDKVAGRFEEILFNQPLEQTISLIANALNVRRDRLPRGSASRLQTEMAKSLDLGWYGVDAVRNRILSAAPSLFPLHPTVIPVLVRLFSRFGQNERSLYSFLLSTEPFALQSFADQPAKAESLYRLHNLYDFARVAFGHRLSLQTFRSHWNQIESVVESFPRDQPKELEILKTVAILNLIDSPQLVAGESAIALAVESGTSDSGTSVTSLLKSLQSDKAVLYYRGLAGGYCLWPHTSVNLERAYQDARDAVPIPQRIGPFIREKLETRALVARRHYIETGTLRHFDVHFVPAADLQATAQQATHADGHVIVVLCETEAERRQAIDIAASEAFSNRPEVLTAIPKPLQGLASLLGEVQRWEWVLANVPELNHDNYAIEEATRQLTAARQVLGKRLQSYVGLRQFTETVGLEWFHRGKPLALSTGRALLEKLSHLCDSLYPNAPKIHNELVNRHELSSAASAARLRLIDRLLRQSGEPYLGMDPATKPPEMSMYLSVLKEARLHGKGSSGWHARIPNAGTDPCNIRPVMSHIQEVLEAAESKRVKITDLFRGMTDRPFGVREGLCPLLLAVFAVIHEQDVAFYDQGTFMTQMAGQEFHRLIKAPEHFEVQYCRIAGVRALVFEHVFKALNPGRELDEVDLLDVVRPLCVFAAQLPEFAKKTKQVSKFAAQVRESLFRAEEPAALLFHSLPTACGMEPFGPDTAPSAQSVKQFVGILKDSIDELRAAYPQLLQAMADRMRTCFGKPGSLEKLRNEMASAAGRVLPFIREPRLKAFCTRLTDRALADDLWIESMGSFLCSKPPSRWIDQDFASFEDELHRCARQFMRVESTLFDRGQEAAQSQAMRISITCQDGSEVEKVVRLSQDEASTVLALEERIRSVLAGDQRLGLIAASKVILAHLQGPEA